MSKVIPRDTKFQPVHSLKHRVFPFSLATREYGENIPNYYTQKLADFGFREIKIQRETLTLWGKNGLPGEFCDQHVKSAMNKSSGYVFLVNSDHQTAMINHENNRLEI